MYIFKCTNIIYKYSKVVFNKFNMNCRYIPNMYTYIHILLADHLFIMRVNVLRSIGRILAKDVLNFKVIINHFFV